MKRVVNKDNLKKFIDLINGKPNKPVKPNSEYAKKLTKKQTKEMIDVIKNTPSPTKPNNKWEKEFEKRFGYWFKDPMNENLDKGGKLGLKFFISKTLQQQREEVIKEIEGIEELKDEIPTMSEPEIEVDNKLMRNQLRKQIRERLLLIK